MEDLFWQTGGILKDQQMYLSSPIIYPNWTTNKEEFKVIGNNATIANEHPGYMRPDGLRYFTHYRNALTYDTGNMTLIFIQKGNPVTDYPLMFSHIYDYCLSGGTSCLLPGGYKPFSTNWSLIDGSWTICAMTIDSRKTRIKAFRNGLKVDDIVNPGIVRNTSHIYISHKTGAEASAIFSRTTALWSDFVIYQTILTDQQILEVTRYYANKYNLPLEV